MPQQIQCAQCGQWYVLGQIHNCPMHPQQMPIGNSGVSGTDKMLATGCIAGRLGCCLLELLPFGCMLPIGVITLVTIFLRHRPF